MHGTIFIMECPNNKSLTAALPLFFISLLLSGRTFSECSRTFTIVNHCRKTIWPVITPGTSSAFLRPGRSLVFRAPIGWTGRIWGRTGCGDDRSGHGSSLNCSGSGKPPITLTEFTLTGDVDYYDLSLTDGFNLPIVVTPVNGKGNCSVVGCRDDLRRSCPPELAVKSGGRVVGCGSPCDVFNTDKYCCRGAYGNWGTCRPTWYSRQLKQACPTAYSYPYDDPTSIFTCSGSDYVVSFCSCVI